MVSSPASTPVPRLLPDLLAGAVLLLLQTWGWQAGLDLPSTHAWFAWGAYGVLTALLLTTASATLPRPGMGWANRVTLFRSTLVLPVAALLVTPGSVGGSTAWAAVVVATVALALDGVDGAVARRTRTSTRFGARFDMELDAFLILALALLVWAATPLGSWVVWIGAMRYLFVVAGWVWAPLRAELPDSFRRKAVCVVQVAGLLVALAPVTPAPVDFAVSAVALAALTWSFAVDVLWLVRNAPLRSTPSPR